MKRYVPLALTAAFAAALVVVGCTVESTGNNDNPDAGPSGQPDGSTPDDREKGNDAGPDGAKPPTEVVEAVGNDSFDTAQEVPTGTLLQANMTNGEEDFFKTMIPAGAHDGVLRLTMHETSSSFHPRIAIHGSDKSEYGYDYAKDANTDPFIFEFHVTAGKQYFVKISGGTNGETIPYTVDFAFTPVADTYERNDTFDDAKDAPMGTPFDLFIFAGADTNDGADVDLFKINAPADKTKLRVKLDNKGPLGYRVSLFDKNKNEKSYDYFNPTANYDDTLDLPAGGGLVYVRFDESGGDRRSTIASKVTLSFE